jgi:uncharacterized protein with GYD domain
MALYIFTVKYTAESWATQIRDQGNVLERLEPAVDSLKGTITGCYYAVGDYDLVLLAEFPGDEEASAMSLITKAGGSLESITRTRLMSVEQGLSAMRLAAQVAPSYHPPVTGKTTRAG